MTPLECLMAKLGKGIVSRDAAERLAETISTFEEEYARRFGREDAARAAATAAADEASRVAAREAELALGLIEAQLSVLQHWGAMEKTLGALRGKATQDRFLDRWKAIVSGENKAPLWLADPRKSGLMTAMRAMVTRDPAEIATWGNWYYQARAVRAEAHALFRDGIAALKPAAFGLKRETALEMDVLRAIKDKGAAVPEQARAIADAWAKAAEFLRNAFVEARGALPFRENWGLPNPVHDPLKVRSFAKSDWIDFVTPLLDRKAMLDFDTGRRLTSERLGDLLSEMYDTVAAAGADGPPSSAQRGRGALAGRRAESRFLVFKDAASWLAYDAAFGSGRGVFETMMQHLHDMADDVSMLRIFGPNPEATKRFILSLFDREGDRLRRQVSGNADPKAAAQAYRDNVKIQSYVNSGRAAFENLWSGMTGLTNAPVNLEWAHRIGEARSALVASKMGSALLSSFADLGNLTMIARFNALPVTRVLERAVAGMADKSFELNAVQLGLVADSVSYLLHQTDRFMGEAIRTGHAAQIGNAVIGASGLRRWTGVLRTAFGLEFMAQGANHLATSHANLPERFRQALARYGLSPADWEVIRKAAPSEPTPGGRFLTAADIRQVDGGAGRIADAWARMIDTEMDYAVIDADPLTRSFLLGSSRPGTLGGEARRSFGQFKGFAVTIISTHLARAAARGFDGDRLAHGALTFAAMTALGMLSYQAKEIVKGRDPVSMDPTTRIGARAWGAAVLQGGGLGIFGDLLFQDQTRQGTSFAAAVAGPLPGAFEHIVGDFLMANIQRVAKGEKTHFAGDALYVASGLLPGANLWYARTAFQRAVLDQLALMIDDRAPERFRRIEREAEKSWGQRHWWEPGVKTPRRVPDLAAAAGSHSQPP